MQNTTSGARCPRASAYHLVPYSWLCDTKRESGIPQRVSTHHLCIVWKIELHRVSVNVYPASRNVKGTTRLPAAAPRGSALALTASSIFIPYQIYHSKCRSLQKFCRMLAPTPIVASAKTSHPAWLREQSSMAPQSQTTSVLCNLC